MLYLVIGEDLPKDIYVAINLAPIPGVSSDNEPELNFNVQIHSPVEHTEEELRALLQFFSSSPVLANTWLLNELGDRVDQVVVGSYPVSAPELSAETDEAVYVSQHLVIYRVTEEVYASVVEQYTKLLGAITRNAIARRTRQDYAADVSKQLAETAIAAAAGKISPTPEEGSKDNGPL